MRLVLALLVATLLGVSTSARAQGPDIKECGFFDTTVNTTTAYAVLGACSFTTGPTGLVIVAATFEATCGTAGEYVQLFIAPGTSPVNGSNFIGHASGGTLTLESNVFGFGLASPWIIQAGQLLTGGTGAAFTPTAITAQLTQASVANTSLSWSSAGGGTVTVTTASPHVYHNPLTEFVADDVIIAGVTPSGYNGTRRITSAVDNTHFTYSLTSDPGTETVPGTTTSPPGAQGTYSIADSGLTISAGTNLYSLNQLPGGMTALTRERFQDVCKIGFVITSHRGAIALTPYTNYWIGQTLKSGANGQSATLNNATVDVTLP
jgi:hypothetical protein